MILAIGEILADICGKESADGMQLTAHVGGAPFNVAVNAVQCGAEVGFIGRVGDDVIGRFIAAQAAKVKFNRLEIQIDKKRNTTLAFVSLLHGERDFTFFRNNTADYYIDADKIDLLSYADLSVVHIGSLMLSEKKGAETAEKIIEKAKFAGKLLSFDVNFRSDVFNSIKAAEKAYNKIIERADVVKFSIDELLMLSHEKTLEKAIAKYASRGKLIFVTMGKDGSACYRGDESVFAPSQKVTPIDTTGAGDAFFGTALALLDGKNIKAVALSEIKTILEAANDAGAKATQFYGAVKI